MSVWVLFSVTDSGREYIHLVLQVQLGIFLPDMLFQSFKASPLKYGLGSNDVRSFGNVSCNSAKQKQIELNIARRNDGIPTVTTARYIVQREHSQLDDVN